MAKGRKITVHMRNILREEGTGNIPKDTGWLCSGSKWPSLLLARRSVSSMSMAGPVFSHSMAGPIIVSYRLKS